MGADRCFCPQEIGRGRYCYISVLVSDYLDLQLWILFANSKDSSVYDVGRKIYDFLGPAKCRAIPFFVTFTRCDTTSQFARKGKLSDWKLGYHIPRLQIDS